MISSRNFEKYTLITFQKASSTTPNPVMLLTNSSFVKLTLAVL